MFQNQFGTPNFMAINQVIIKKTVLKTYYQIYKIFT